MKKLIIASCCLPLFAMAMPKGPTPLANYQSIVNAVESGEHLTVSINFADCSPSLPDGISMQSSYQPKAVIILKSSKEENIGFADTHYTLSNPAFPAGVYENVSYKIRPDGGVQIVTKYLDPSNHALEPASLQPKEPETCNLGAEGGVLVFGY